MQQSEGGGNGGSPFKATHILKQDDSTQNNNRLF